MVKKTALFFGLLGYFLTVLYYFGPGGVRLNETLFHFVPFWMCILTGHGMPILPVAFLIAPVNADIYGAMGWAIASLAMLVRRVNRKLGYYSRIGIPRRDFQGTK